MAASPLHPGFEEVLITLAAHIQKNGEEEGLYRCHSVEARTSVDEWVPAGLDTVCCPLAAPAGGLRGRCGNSACPMQLLRLWFQVAVRNMMITMGVPRSVAPAILNPDCEPSWTWEPRTPIWRTPLVLRHQLVCYSKCRPSGRHYRAMSKQHQSCRVWDTSTYSSGFITLNLEMQRPEPQAPPRPSLLPNDRHLLKHHLRATRAATVGIARGFKVDAR